MSHFRSLHPPGRRLTPSSVHTYISPSTRRQPHGAARHDNTRLPIPTIRQQATPSQTRRPFTTTHPLSKRRAKPNAPRDPRIRNIRYHLMHPLTPRPLRFSRNRFLRHWTIHRAWHLLRKKQSDARELALQRQYMSMKEACEALRLIGEDGLAVGAEPGERAVRPPGARDPAVVRVRTADEEGAGAKQKEGEKEDGGIEMVDVDVDVASAAETQKEVGRLYRIAMEKRGVFQGVPIEYARAQTDTPSRTGWDHEWKRGKK